MSDAATINALMARIKELEAEKAQKAVKVPSVYVQHGEYQGHAMMALKGGNIHWQGINMSVKKWEQVLANVDLLREEIKRYG